MRIARAVRIPGVALATILVFVAGAAGAADRDRTARDRFWTAPDAAAYPVASIALLPAATYDGSVEARRVVEQAVSQALRGSGHRWVSAFLARDFLQKSGGDSLLQAINGKLLKSARVDSLEAPALCRIVRARAVLAVRVDQLERRELEPDQSGRPTTSVQLRGALVDSTGRLLWTAQSEETLEGSAQDASANVIGVKASGLNTTTVGGTSPAPSYAEVLAKVGQRWADAFPRRAARDSSAAGK